jgi:hypothetical protein
MFKKKFSEVEGNEINSETEKNLEKKKKNLNSDTIKTYCRIKPLKTNLAGKI